MINLIVADNATGKTCALQELLFKDENGTSDLLPIEILQFIELDAKIIEEVKARFDLDLLIEGRSILKASGPNYFNEIETFSSLFVGILNVCLKQRMHIYLDEPEIGLSQSEVSLLVSIVRMLSNEYERDVWITTHTQDWLGVAPLTFFTIENGKLVEGYEGELDELLLPF